MPCLLRFHLIAHGTDNLSGSGSLCRLNKRQSRYAGALYKDGLTHLKSGAQQSAEGTGHCLHNATLIIGYAIRQTVHTSLWHDGVLGIAPVIRRIADLPSSAQMLAPGAAKIAFSATHIGFDDHSFVQ